MSTFAQWLSEQETRGPNTPVGWLAHCWKGFEGNRPKLSSPTSIKKFLSEHGSQTAEWQGYLDQAADLAIRDYRERSQPAAAESHEDSVQRLAAVGPQIDPATGQDRRYQGASPEEIAAAEHAAGAVQEADFAPVWAVEPAERLGKCLKCGLLMGVALISGEKALACANGHVVGGSKQPKLGDIQLQPSAATESDEQIRELDESGEVMEIRSGYEQLNRLQEQPTPTHLDLYVRLQAVETMQGLVVQMLAAASPAAAGVLMEHVQGENPAADGSGPPETLLSEFLNSAADAVQPGHQPDAYSDYRPQTPAVPQSFEAWMGLAGESDG